jgi:hypothetical protein
VIDIAVLADSEINQVSGGLYHVLASGNCVGGMKSIALLKKVETEAYRREGGVAAISEASYIGQSQYQSSAIGAH